VALANPFLSLPVRSGASDNSAGDGGHSSVSSARARGKKRASPPYPGPAVRCWRILDVQEEKKIICQLARARELGEGVHIDSPTCLGLPPPRVSVQRDEKERERERERKSTFIAQRSIASRFAYVPCFTWIVIIIVADII